MVGETKRCGLFLISGVSPGGAQSGGGVNELAARRPAPGGSLPRAPRRRRRRRAHVWVLLAQLLVHGRHRPAGPAPLCGEVHHAHRARLWSVCRRGREGVRGRTTVGGQARRMGAGGGLLSILCLALPSLLDVRGRPALRGPRRQRSIPSTVGPPPHAQCNAARPLTCELLDLLVKVRVALDVFDARVCGVAGASDSMRVQNGEKAGARRWGRSGAVCLCLRRGCWRGHRLGAVPAAQLCAFMVSQVRAFTGASGPRCVGGAQRRACSPAAAAANARRDATAWAAAAWLQTARAILCASILPEVRRFESLTRRSLGEICAEGSIRVQFKYKIECKLCSLRLAAGQSIGAVAHHFTV